MDYFTEALVGERGAIKTKARIVLRPRVGATHGLTQIGIWGAILSEFGTLVKKENEGFNEMWECDIIIIPKKKYSAHKKNDKRGKPSYSFKGYRADQMLCGGYEHPEAWGEKYFDSSS